MDVATAAAETAHTWYQDEPANGYRLVLVHIHVAAVQCTNILTKFPISKVSFIGLFKNIPLGLVDSWLDNIILSMVDL